MPTQKQDEDTTSYKDSIKPDFLRGTTGIGPDEEKAMEDKAYSGAADDIAAREGLGGKPDHSGTDRDPADSADAAANEEKSQLDDRIGGGLTADKSGRGNRKRGRFTRRQKLIGGGVAVFGGGAIGVFLLFLPVLRLESYLARINQRAFTLAASAVERRAGHLFERYMISHALDLERCNNVISNACRSPIAGGLTGGLFQAWRDVRIEQKMLDRYGLEIRSLNNPDRSSGANRFEIIDRSNGNRLVTLTNGDVRNGRFNGGSRVLGRDIRTFLRQETKWYELMHRRSLRKYLTRKHGIRLWCFFACKTRDNTELRFADAKTRFKYRFVERFIFPFSGKYGFIMTCVISGGNCDGEDLRNKGIDRGRLPDADVAEITDYFKSNPNARVSQYVVEKLLQRVMSTQAARAVTSAIPVAGQIYFGLVVIDIFDRLDGYIANGGLSKFAADLNARQYLEYYAGMRSVNDEMKSHVLGLDEVGAVMAEFDGAEESLVYQEYNQNNQVALLFGGRAHAQGTESREPYTCDDGKPIPKGEYVCREKKVGGRTFVVEDWRNNRVVGGLIGALNRYDCAVPQIAGHCPPGASPRSYIRPVLNSIDKIVNGVLSPVLSVALTGLRHIPGVSSLISFAEGAFKNLMLAFFGNVFPLPVQLDSPGREKYDGLEAGADVAASEFGKGGYNKSDEPYGLGAPAITDEELFVITQDYLEQQQHNYRQLGLADRLMSLEYPQSLASKVILSVPTQASQYPNAIASAFSNAISGLGGILTGRQHVYAQKQLAINAFGVTRYGYPLSHPSITADPEKITEEYCEQAKKEWEASMTEDELTGFDEYSIANPCLLELTTIETAGALFVE